MRRQCLVHAHSCSVPWERLIWMTYYIKWGSPDSSVSKESVCNAGDPSSIPGSGRSPGEGKDYPLQYSGLENSMHYIVHGVPKSWTRLSDFHFTLEVLTLKLCFNKSAR